MEYDIIDEVAGLANDGVGLESVLKRAAEAILRSVPFDQCSIYLWDAEKRSFVLSALAGEGFRAEVYGETEGLPGRVKKKMDSVTLTGTGSRKSDSGLSGFGYALAVPLKSGRDLSGVLYLKSKSPSKSFSDKGLKHTALFLAQVIRAVQAESRHRKVSSELTEAEAKLQRTEKLMALVDMAASLAHEIKNPLISIGGFATRLKRHLGPDSEGHPYVEMMVREIQRVEKLINGIMRFLKESGADKRPDDINDILKDALKFFEDDLGAGGIALVLDLYDGPLPVMADREQMTIAFDNLIANAIQSMENGGVLKLSTRLVRDSIVVKLKDSGGGIDPRNISYIFNPFFTTKKNGTGLGLPIASSIMLRHNGVIEVENDVGIGVTFVLKLPLAG